MRRNRTTPSCSIAARRRVAVQAGDGSAIRELNAERDAIINQWSGLIPWSIRRLKNCRDVAKADREDVRSEAGIGLLKAAEWFDPSLGYKFSTYASRVISRSIFALCHRDRYTEENRKEYSMSDIGCAQGGGDEFPDGDCVDSDGGIATLVDKRCRLAAVNEAIKLLSPRDALIIRLRFQHEHTLEAIGGFLGIGRGSVRQVVDDALERLRDRVALG